MRAFPFVVMAALLVSACAAGGVQPPAPSTSAGSAPLAPAADSSSIRLDGSHWRFVKVAGAAVPAAVVATMRFADGRASGKAGCNAYGATYDVAGNGVAHFQQTLSTRMACLQPHGAMQVEQGIFAAFRRTAKVELGNGTLRLLDAGGQPLATLVRDTAQP